MFRLIRHPAAGWTPAFLGPVRLAGSWTSGKPRPQWVGQSGAPKDASRVVSSVEYQNLPWTKDEAIQAFNLANLSLAIMEKLRFSRAVFSNMETQPKINTAMNAAGAGDALSKAVSDLNQLLDELNLPNAIASTRNLQNALETAVFPKFGVGVKGVRPYFTPSPIPMLSPVSTNTTGGKSEIIDFGDLTQTDLATDMDALKVASSKMQDVAPEVKMSGIQLGNPIVIAIVWGVGVLVAGLLGWKLLNYLDNSQKAAKPPITDPSVKEAVREVCDTLPPDKRAECYITFVKNASINQGSTDTWLYLGIGVAAAIGIFGIASFIKAVKE